MPEKERDLFRREQKSGTRKRRKEANNARKESRRGEERGR